MRNELTAIIREAGEMLKEGYYSKKCVSFKSEVDLVTQYDIEIEKFLTKRLKEIYPDFEIVGEEEYSESRYPSNAIFVDPIDGTTNFVHGIPFVAVSIGIFKDSEPIEGAVYNPVLDELFYAKKGEGAFLNKEPIEVSAATLLQKSLIATGFPYTKVTKGRDYRWVIETMKELLPKTRDIRRLGSAAIDLCYTAKGIFDGFYEINLKPWDTAAGILIVEEAGGRVSNEKGEKYRFGDIVVASNGKVHEDLLKNIARY
ncbi:inositol monophosphatase family protein [Nitrosophilus alvini]|uniref:inositol monophosphatase family protein n=1 Tax=Nitrosophilus alvini TaxID=2714855 RepID=UPI00190C7709|nr:inositol monophosphatase family protein [Nitrosophilus alvini]